MRQLALVVVALALVPTAARALIPEPPHVVRGAVTVNGAPRTWGTVTLRLAGSPEANGLCRLAVTLLDARGGVIARDEGQGLFTLVPKP